MIGKTFGNLTILKFVYTAKNYSKYYLCECVCGKEKVCRIDHLKSGGTTSCGCYRNICTSLRMKTHGMENTRTYQSWLSMKGRTRLKSNPSYREYGGRGITCCDRWFNSFESFFKDMGEKPSELHSLERLNNSKGYYKRNCKWATKKEQNRNTRQNVYLTFKGVTKCIAEWAEFLQVKCPALRARFNRGWSVEDTLTRPFRRSPVKERLTHVNKKDTIRS